MAAAVAAAAAAAAAAASLHNQVLAQNHINVPNFTITFSDPDILTLTETFNSALAVQHLTPARHCCCCCCCSPYPGSGAEPHQRTQPHHYIQ
jgi:hypothetical protein